MDNQIINETFFEFKFHLNELLKTVHQFSFDLRNDEIQKIISNLRTNINEPFLFVVVGEVKAGKSSFINALLKEKICEVDAAPCTDIIQQIVYSEQKTESNLNPFLKRIGLPVESLKTIAIVDTPGTNTIIKHHQEITQKFIPNGDLVLVVFTAKNPYTQSAWDLLEYVNEEWRKQVVFVLHQSDLAKPEELKTNIRKVKEYAIQKNISAPHVFVTSAEWEAIGDKRSGFEEVRKFIRNTVTGGNHYKLKLISILETSERVLKKLDANLENQKIQYETDHLIVQRVRSRLATGEQQSSYEVKSLINRLVMNYNRIAEEVKLEFKQGLSLVVLFKNSFKAIFQKEKSTNKWIENLQFQFEKRLKLTFEENASEGAIHFIDGIRHLLYNLLDELNRIKVTQIQNKELATSIDERRQEVIDDVKEKVSLLLNNDSFVNSLRADPATIAPTFMGGGVLAIIGTIILTATHSAFFDVTGGVLTGIGLLLAGGVLVFKKGKIIRQFEHGLDEGKRQFETELIEKLSSKLKIVYEDIDRSFVEFYDYVIGEEKKLKPMIKTFNEINEEFLKLSGLIKSK